MTFCLYMRLESPSSVALPSMVSGLVSEVFLHRDSQLASSLPDVDKSFAKVEVTCWVSDMDIQAEGFIFCCSYNIQLIEELTANAVSAGFFCNGNDDFG